MPNLALCGVFLLLRPQNMLPEKFIPLIERLGQRFGEPELLTVVTEALQTGNAIPVYHMNMLLILKPVFDGIGRPGILAWVGIHTDGQSMAEDFTFIYRMAKATGMQFIRFETKRKGFVKLAARYGYRPVGMREDYTIYQKEV